ncbi:hypothetical protein; putative exported protein [Herminiimonas arsenicoxydans]|uniref:Lipoprotein n=1 Tax=Herminiimonas arsenicoxydans TaxID=204773 RepID=A4G358_HERAR|nr:hypothetical protein; putative exported protein [Herminiimonas arsenicoxydans]
MNNMKTLSLSILLLAVSLAGCVTMSGNYVVSGTLPDGTDMKWNVSTQGRGIYTVRNGMCAAHPGATVFIRDAQTGQELKDESPYKCRK